MKTFNIPQAFCWTKMGTEAGQSLENIILRKDYERIKGDGVFFWGIGTALGFKIWEYIDSVDTPMVIFSPMKAKPKKIDVIPEKVFLWTSYFDRWGNKHPIPEYAKITSRGITGFLEKKYHYALVCRKTTPLLNEYWPKINSNLLFNFNSNSKLGYSQVTAVVEQHQNDNNQEFIYDILFSAELVSPYYIKLCDPVELIDFKTEERAVYNPISLSDNFQF